MLVVQIFGIVHYLHSMLLDLYILWYIYSLITIMQYSLRCREKKNVVMSNLGNDDGLKISVMAVAVVCCLFSGYIIASYMLFKEMQQRVFMTIIFYISCADFCMNSTTFIGFPANGSVLCWLQGIFLVYYFPKATFMTI